MEHFKEITKKFAHDVRNPLGGIIGCAELLEADLPENPKWNKRVSGILSAANKVNELIAELLDATQGVPVVKSQTTHPESVVKILSLMQKSLENHENLKISLAEKDSYAILTVREKGSEEDLFSVNIPNTKRGTVNV